MPTSGTTGSTVFSNQQLIDHAFRRCKMVPQEITGEHIETALDLLWLITQPLVNRGIPLWNVNKIILPIYEKEQSIATPVGTVDVLDANLRTHTRIIPTEANATASEGTPFNAFDTDPTTACTQIAPAGNIKMELASAQAIETFGILPNAAGTWAYVIEASNDDVTYTTLITETAQVVVAGEWLWYDVEGVTAYDFWRLRATGATVLDVAELMYQTSPSEIPLYKLNRRDYSNLPDKVNTGRPTQYWYDKQINQPIITVWPAPQFEFTFAQLTCMVLSQIEDVGTMVQQLEVPDRWYLGIICNLAAHLGREIKEVDESIVPRLDQDSTLHMNDAWAGESDGSSSFFRPNISPYTR